MSGYEKLIKRGVKRFCEFSKEYYHADEMNPDGDGGYINKKFDVNVHNEEINQSKFKKGLSGGRWQRGVKG